VPVTVTRIGLLTEACKSYGWSPCSKAAVKQGGGTPVVYPGVYQR